MPHPIRNPLLRRSPVSFERALGVAALVHGIALATLARDRHALREAVPPPKAPLEALEVALIEEANGHRDDPLDPSRPDDPAPAAIAPTGSRDAARGPSPATPRGLPEAGEEPSPPGPKPPEWSESPPEDRGIPGLTGPRAWSIPGVIAPPDAPRPAPTQPPAPRAPNPDAAGEAIRSSLSTVDREKGFVLPAAPIIATAAEDVVRSAETVSNATASFEVRLDRDGKVASVHFAGATAGHDVVWRRLQKRLADVLANRKLPMRGDAATRGAKVVVRVQTRDVFPSGGRTPGGLVDVGAHATRVVSSRVDVTVPGERELAGELKSAEKRWPWGPPKPNEVDRRPNYASQPSGAVPVNPGDSFRKHPSEE